MPNPLINDVISAFGGRYLAALSSDRVIRLWELSAGREVRQFRGGGERKGHFAFSPDNRLLAWSWGEKIRLWDLASGREIGQILCHPDTFECLTFIQDRHTLVSSNGRTTWVWDTTTGQALRKIITAKYDDAIAIGSSEGCLLYLRSRTKSPECSLREARTLRDIVSQEGNRVERCAVSPDGKTLALMIEPVLGPTETITLREIATSGVLGSLSGGHRSEIPNPSFWVESAVLAFSPDGHYLASGGIDSTILIWDWKRGCGVAARSDDKRNSQDREGLWADLAANDARTAYQAISTLMAQGDAAVAFLRERLHPVSAADYREPIRRLCRELDSEHYEVRERASRELAKLSAETEPILRAILRGKPSLETRRRLEAVLSALPISRWPADMLRQVRAVQVLEQIGSPAARNVLEYLSRGEPEARLTYEAKAALRRLTCR